MADWDDFREEEEERAFDVRVQFVDSKLEELHDKLDTKERTHGKLGEYHPSQLYDMCAIEQFFSRKDPVPQVENLGSPTRRVMSAGSNAHDYYQQAELGQAGLLMGTWKCTACDWASEPIVFRPDECPSCGCPWIRFSETRIFVEDLNIVGSYDGILAVQEKKYTLEMKSKTKDTYNSITKPSVRELFQASLYDKYNDVDTEGIVFGYICRERYYFKTIFVDRDEKAVAKAIKRINLIEEAIKKDVIPLDIDPTCRRCAKCDSQRAKACPANKVCWEHV